MLSRIPPRPPKSVVAQNLQSQSNDGTPQKSSPLLSVSETNKPGKVPDIFWDATLSGVNKWFMNHCNPIASPDECSIASPKTPQQDVISAPVKPTEQNLLARAPNKKTKRNADPQPAGVLTTTTDATLVARKKNGSADEKQRNVKRANPPAGSNPQHQNGPLPPIIIVSSPVRIIAYPGSQL